MTTPASPQHLEAESGTRLAAPPHPVAARYPRDAVAASEPDFHDRSRVN